MRTIKDRDLKQCRPQSSTKERDLDPNKQLLLKKRRKKKITLEREPENSLTTKKKRPQKPLILPFMALEACGSGAKRCTSNPISIKPLFQYRAIGLSSLSEPYKCSDLLAILHMFVSARRDFYRTRVQGCCKFMG